VFRQLAQDDPAFWQYCHEQAKLLHTDAVTVAAKLVGRWPSGASLVRHPKGDPRSPRFENEDDFAYLANGADNDRVGARCPFGSHLRRTNPRDWDSGAKRSESIEIANRHRIIRRGRPYGEPLVRGMAPEGLVESARRGEDAGERGLQFLAFSADLERQFEFVQQQWSQNPTFAGQASAPDPINSGKGTAPAFTIQSDSEKASFGRCTGLTHFVTVLGSGYFFMPSLSAVRNL
jgi:deferrochelatase/peroxidase EfeB